MSTKVYPDRPWLPDDLVENWPKPSEVSHRQWRFWDLAERQRWLIDHTFEKSGDGWVQRSDHASGETAQRVEQTVTTFEGVSTVFEDVTNDLVDRVRRDRRATHCPICDERIGERPHKCKGDLPTGAPGRRGRIASLSLPQVVYVLLAVLIFSFFVAALLTDWFGSGGESSTDSSTPTGELVTVAPIDSIAVDEATASTIASAGDAMDASDAPTGTITFSSVPDHIRYAKTWSDGEFGLTLDPDGTYRLVSAGIDEVGRFKMTTEDGVDRILFLDPTDPTEITTTLQMPVTIVDGVLVYGQGDAARRLNQVAALPVIATVYPPPQRLDYAAAASVGSWVSEHPGLRWVGSPSDGVSYVLSVGSVTGGLDIDLAKGVIAGTGNAALVCDAGRCVNLDTDVVTGSATIAIESGVVTGYPGRWGFEGTADVTADWNATIACTAGTCTWPYSLSIEMPYSLALVESEAIGYLRFEGVDGITPDGIAYEIYFTIKVPFTVS